MNFFLNNETIAYPYNFKQCNSFLIGVARILDITTSLSPRTKVYYYGRDPEFEDFYAIYRDWKAIGDDIKNSISDVSLPSK